jgi:hypothetical protein
MTSVETTTTTTIIDPATELKIFKQKVRRLAIQAYSDNDWCLRGLNDALRQLGLPIYAGFGAWSGRAELSAEIELQGRLESEFTQQSALQWLKVVSNDSDVRITGDATVTAFAPGEDEWTFRLTVEVPVQVTDTADADVADDWARSALRLDWTTRYLSISDDSVTAVLLAEETDPDVPGTTDTI